MRVYLPRLSAGNNSKVSLKFVYTFHLLLKVIIGGVMVSVIAILPKVRGLKTD
jgi:hypothetical protein